ncbi:glucose 1-dehydrogenase [Streptomyces sp. NPDC002896]|uniref:SDR family NAD(P)-dependent oxidoreductase n=1 Tax=Streptomyces sp. NPDC002896 TaxID=3154438 RepID=UPI003330AAF7
MGAQFDLTGKVAIVTGSTKGLGRAMAHGLAAAGASVVVSSRKQDLCEEVAKEIAAATGAETLGLSCHVGDWDAIPGFVQQIVERLGTVDILVNNAGINPTFVGMADMPLDLWRKVFSVNLEGPLRMSQAVVPVMRERGGGSIINIGTMGAYGGGTGVGAYGPSKAALLSLTRICATEWAPWRIRVNAISPGPIESEMTKSAERSAPGFRERMAKATMLNRIAESHEIAGPVVYLASDASSFVTGEDHLVSGGMLR